MGALSEIGASILLFFLVFGMSATVDMDHLKKQLRNRKALLTGISLQFLILPFVGFVVVNVLRLDDTLGITLLVITSSPGGSYSNWWCSMFNADLALSVTMTAISTLLSVIMLPVNLILYTTISYSGGVVKSLDWHALFWSLLVVIGAIGTGLFCSARVNSHTFNHRANKMGNIAGVTLVAYSAALSSSDHDARLWDQTKLFYFGVATPPVLGLIIATYIASRINLEKPERVAVAVEACYQNTAVATSVAISMFQGEELAIAIGVPLYYGIVEAVILAIYCMVCWKCGWTKAPRDENICTVLATSYEVEEYQLEHPDAIEVVLGKPGTPNDLIFAQTREGYMIDDESLRSISNSGKGDEDTLSSVDEDGGDGTSPQTPRTVSREKEGQEEKTEIEGPGDGPREKRPPQVHPNSPTAIPTGTDGVQIVADDSLSNGGGQGRFGRAISTIRARATGYRHASFGVGGPASPDDVAGAVDGTSSPAAPAKPVGGE